MKKQYKKTLCKLSSKDQVLVYKIDIDEHPDGTATVTRVAKTGLNGTPVINKEHVTDGKNIGRANETSPIEQANVIANTQYNKKLDSGYKEFSEFESQTEDTIREILVSLGRTDASGNVIPMTAQKFKEGKTKSYVEEDSFRFVAGQEGKDLIPLDDNELRNALKKCHHIIWSGGKKDPLDSFSEMSKFLFAKINDETNTKQGDYYSFQLSSNQEDTANAERVRRLYSDAISKEAGIFYSEIDLSDHKVVEVVRVLQHIDILNSDVDVKGRAFETFLGSIFRGSLGQYFTKREIVDFIVQVSNVNENSKILDPACGSGGFLLYSMKAVLKYVDENFKSTQASRIRNFFPLQQLFGIEVNVKISKIAKMNMFINEDGHTNIEENTGLNNNFNNPNIRFNEFSHVLTNPPFGWKVDEGDKDSLGGNSLKSFDIIPKSTKSAKSEMLFIEQCYNFLKPKGVIAIIIPDGILNNPSSQYSNYREWILKHFDIKLIVALPEHAFKASGAGVRTSILLAEKRDKKISNVDQVSQILLATAKQIGYDPTGKAVNVNDLDIISKGFKDGGRDHNIFEVITLTDFTTRIDPRHYDRDINSKLELMRERSLIQKGVSVYKLKDLCKDNGLYKGKSWEASSMQDLTEDGIPFIEISKITEKGILHGTGVGSYQDKYMVEDWYERNQKYKNKALKKGDILIAITGATIGKTVIVSEKFEGAYFSADVGCIRLSDGVIDPVYLDAFLNSSLGQIQIYKWINGSTNLHLSMDAVGEFEVPLLDNPEEIVSKIKRLRAEKINSFNSIENIRQLESQLFDEYF